MSNTSPPEIQITLSGPADSGKHTLLNRLRAQAGRLGMDVLSTSVADGEAQGPTCLTVRCLDRTAPPPPDEQWAIIVPDGSMAVLPKGTHAGNAVNAMLSIIDEAKGKPATGRIHLARVRMQVLENLPGPATGNGEA